MILNEHYCRILKIIIPYLIKHSKIVRPCFSFVLSSPKKKIGDRITENIHLISVLQLNSLISNSPCLFSATSFATTNKLCRNEFSFVKIRSFLEFNKLIELYSSAYLYSLTVTTSIRCKILQIKSLLSRVVG